MLPPAVCLPSAFCSCLLPPASHLPINVVTFIFRAVLQSAFDFTATCRFIAGAQVRMKRKIGLHSTRDSLRIEMFFAKCPIGMKSSH